MNITIDLVEAASELAFLELENLYSNEFELYVTDEEDEIIQYTDQAQDIFDELYDKYYTILNELKIKNHEN
jgi:hypothetical protein